MHRALLRGSRTLRFPIVEIIIWFAATSLKLVVLMDVVQIHLLIISRHQNETWSEMRDLNSRPDHS